MGAIKDLQERREALKQDLVTGAAGLRHIAAECDSKIEGEGEVDAALAASARYADSVADWLDDRFNTVR